jgi:hypothetical protein
MWGSCGDHSRPRDERKITSQGVVDQNSSSSKAKSPRHLLAQNKKTSDARGSSAGPPLKNLNLEPAPKNFLGIGAQKAKAARSARKKALVGFNNRVRAKKLTNTWR